MHGTYNFRHVILLRSLVMFLVYESLKNLWLSNILFVTRLVDSSCIHFLSCCLLLRKETVNINVQYEQPCRLHIMIIFFLFAISYHYSGLIPASVADLSVPWPLCLVFVVDKVTLGQVFLRVLRLSPVGVIPYSHSLVYHYRCVNVATEGIVKQHTLCFVFIVTCRFVFLQCSIFLLTG
jgi:hypothetical protein